MGGLTKTRSCVYLITVDLQGKKRRWYPFEKDNKKGPKQVVSALKRRILEDKMKGKWQTAEFINGSGGAGKGKLFLKYYRKSNGEVKVVVDKPYVYYG